MTQPPPENMYMCDGIFGDVQILLFMAALFLGSALIIRIAY